MHRSNQYFLQTVSIRHFEFTFQSITNQKNRKLTKKQTRFKKNTNINIVFDFSVLIMNYIDTLSIFILCFVVNVSQNAIIVSEISSISDANSKYLNLIFRFCKYTLFICINILINHVIKRKFEFQWRHKLRKRSHFCFCEHLLRYYIFT